MRGGVIIALVVVGGAVVVTPVVAEYLLRSSHQANVVRLLERPGTNSVNLQREEIGTGLQVGCWVTGTALAAAGIYLAVRAAREDKRGPGHPGRGSAEPGAAPDPGRL